MYLEFSIGDKSVYGGPRKNLRAVGPPMLYSIDIVGNELIEGEYKQICKLDFSKDHLDPDWYWCGELYKGNLMECISHANSHYEEFIERYLKRTFKYLAQKRVEIN